MHYRTQNRSTWGRSPGGVFPYTLLAALCLLAMTPRSASAFPNFARKYGVPCARCHSMVPRLNPFGYAFYRAGFRMPTPQHKPITLGNTTAVVSAIDFQKTPGGPDMTLSEADVVGTVNPTRNLTFHGIYTVTNTAGISSGIAELWTQYNSAAQGNYWSVRVGQMPELDGYQLLGQRSITLTDPVMFGALGPIVAGGESAFSVAGLERGVEIGYNTANKMYNRVAWYQGVDETGNGALGLNGSGHWQDFLLESEYFIGTEGSAVQAFYYNGHQPLTSSGYTNPFQRAGVFVTYGHNIQPGRYGIPKFRYELNAGGIWGQDQTAASGTTKDSWGAVVEADAYWEYRDAVAVRFDSGSAFSATSATGSAPAGLATSTTQAFTFALQHRANNLLQFGVEYRHQTGPTADSWIGEVRVTY